MKRFERRSDIAYIFLFAGIILVIILALELFSEGISALSSYGSFAILVFFSISVFVVPILFALRRRAAIIINDDYLTFKGKILEAASIEHVELEKVRVVKGRDPSLAFEMITKGIVKPDSEAIFITYNEDRKSKQVFFNLDDYDEKEQLMGALKLFLDTHNIELEIRTHKDWATKVIP